MVAAKKVDALEGKLTGEFEALQTALEARLDERDAALAARDAALSAAMAQRSGPSGGVREAVDERLDKMDQRFDRFEALLRRLA